MPFSGYGDAFRPQGLDGTAMEGFEPVLGVTGKESEPPPPRRYCSTCAHLRCVEDGESLSQLYFCSRGLLPSYNSLGQWVSSNRVFGQEGAQCIQTRCRDYEKVREVDSASYQTLEEVPSKFRSLSQLIDYGNFRAAPTALIDPNAEICEGARIWHYSIVGEHAKIGKDCVIGSHVIVDRGVVIGDRCHIQNGACLYRGVILGDDVFVGPNVTFTNDRYPRAHNDKFKLEATIVKRYASIGAGATVLCGLMIGWGSMVGAGAVVTKDVPEGATVVGMPANCK